MDLWWHHAKWSTAFHESVTDVIANGGLTVDLSAKMLLLEQLADTLENEPETTDAAAKGSMLALWILVVSHIDKVSILSYKYTCFRLALALLRRQEFNLMHLDFDFNTQDVRKEGDREAWRLVHLYRKLVSDTFTYSSTLLLNTNQSEETQRFCATVAVHAFFVFPMIQAPFIDICTWRYCHHQAMHVSALHTELDAAVRAMALQTHTEFMDRTPDLFHWGWLAKPTDPSILPDDSSWRLLLEANDGHLFCAFVRAFHSHVAATIDASASHISVVSWDMVPGYLKLMQLFSLVLYDSMVWLLHQDGKETEDDNKKRPSLSLFPMTSELADSVLATATVLTGNGLVVQLWFPAVVAAIDSIKTKSTPGLERIVATTTEWTQRAGGNFLHHHVNDDNHDNEESAWFQNVLLYPSFVSLRRVIASFLGLLPHDDEAATVVILQWAYTHMQRLPVEDKDLLATMLLPHFYELFLHWSPRVRLCFHQLLVFQLFRHDRRCLHLASDAVVLTACHDHETKEALASFCFEKPPILSDSPSMILDLSVASKVDSFMYMLREPQSGLFPEALDIFVDISIVEYGECVQDYYNRCTAIEARQGHPLESTDVIQGPDLKKLLAAAATTTAKKH
ncbi:unnamed protein product [Aphanomyces euteiches]|uniref:Uncharacterized protein n=1 Tax=Aphanomyces euteiches TaxID=100861 RepID=A0A6G0WT12_9STRA|nr:hypothetical protein Ae201684_012013 [Aphanomyces euteiches]KAH9056080.1 hypothetical protein Ae201684P_021819 [Aphanomyces euteiches]KAH9154372.1 hypothetical protein AeRB84_003529 [Aphanomyces euteiches]